MQPHPYIGITVSFTRDDDTTGAGVVSAASGDLLTILECSGTAYVRHAGIVRMTEENAATVMARARFAGDAESVPPGAQAIGQLCSYTTNAPGEPPKTVVGKIIGTEVKYHIDIIERA